MYCPSCGTQNGTDARFCQKCGKSLPTTVEAEQPTPNSTKAELPPWPTGGQPYRPAQPIPARTATTVADATPTPITIAVVLYFVVAFLTAGLGALQLLVGATVSALWNIGVGVVCALIGGIAGD